MLDTGAAVDPVLGDFDGGCHRQFADLAGGFLTGDKFLKNLGFDFSPIRKGAKTKKEKRNKD
jgi:hypothetical protein